MNHRVGRAVFALVVGLAVAVYSYRWVTDPAPRAERDLQEAAVMASRSLLLEKTGVETLEFVDPVAPDRKVGEDMALSRLKAQDPRLVEKAENDPALEIIR